MSAEKCKNLSSLKTQTHFCFRFTMDYCFCTMCVNARVKSLTFSADHKTEPKCRFLRAAIVFCNEILCRSCLLHEHKFSININPF